MKSLLLAFALICSLSLCSSFRPGSCSGPLKLTFNYQFSTNVNAIINSYSARRNCAVGKTLMTNLAWETDRVNLEEPGDWPAANVGDIITSSMSYSGLTDEEHIRLYIRNASIDLFRFLDDETNKIKLITGCPGIGKSIQLFSYIMYRAISNKQRVLYIHGDSTHISVLFKDQADSRTARIASYTAPFPQESKKMLFDLIVGELKRDGVDLVVLDGSLWSLVTDISVLMKLFQSQGTKQLIACTSFQALGKIKTETRVKMAPLARFQMDSWTKTECLDAVQCGVVTLPEGVTFEEAYYYAGGNVQYLQLPIEPLINILDDRVASVSSSSDVDVDALLAGKVGDESKGATNSLMAIYDKQSIVISEYVALSLASKLRTDQFMFLRRARSALINHYHWQDLVAKMEFRWLTARSLQMVVQGRSEEAETWQWELETKIYNGITSEELKSIKPQLLLPGRYIRGNPFDAILRISEDEARFILTTSAKTKTNKFTSSSLQQLIPFIKAMNVHVVDVVFLCRKNDFNNFRVPVLDKDEVNSILQEVYENKLRKGKGKSDSKLPSIMLRKVYYGVEV